MPDGARPELSIVLPLLDDRGLGRSALDAWRAQTLEAGRFEVVAVAPDETGPLASAARRRLRPHDQLVVVPGGEEIHLYQAGAEAARGAILLFTEAHCLPEPDTAAALVRDFEVAAAPVLVLGGGAIASSQIARFESRLLREGLRLHQNDAWRRVSLRGLALRRDLWRSAGGFEVGCGRFAEAVLGARLGRLGQPIGEAPTARVRHANCSSYAELAEPLRGLGRGQAAWRERCERQLEVDFLPPLPEWCERARWHRPHARHLAGVALRALLLDSGRQGFAARAGAMVRALPRLLAAALLGPRGPLGLAAVRARLATAAGRLALGEARRFRAYGHASSELLRWGVLERVARRPWLPPAPAATAIHPGAMPDGALVDFHLAERWGEECCRWSRPLALMPFRLPPGDYRATLDLRSPVSAAERCLRCFFNGRPLPAGAAVFDLRREWFRAGGDQRLAIACAPFRPRRSGLPDERELGVAVFRLDLEPAG
jgi:hypothetical protein